MSWRSILVLSLLAGATGCWRESCDQGTQCHERLTGIFDDGTDPGTDGAWCNGALDDFSSCQDLGYTVECQGIWYRPRTEPYPCR